MISDDYIKTVVACPVEWVVCANSTIHADNNLVSVLNRSLQRGLLDAIAFGETVRHMKTCFRAQQVKRPQKNRRSRRAVDVIVAIDENRLTFRDRAQYAWHRVSHAAHKIRVVKLVY